MTELYFHATPNSMKVLLLLEELGQSYTIMSVDIFKGEQHSEAYRAINPNAKVPALVDGAVTVFDSHAILLYLAEKHARFLPSGPAERAVTLSWLQFVATGLSPFSGQAIHFLHYAPEKIPYAINRYVKEVERHYRILDGRLAATRYLAGNAYTIADMAMWGWASSAGYIFGDKGLAEYPHVSRLMAEIAERPAAAHALTVKAGHSRDTTVDQVALRALFPQNV